jgi:anti-sigma B factor antagonist
MNATVHLRPAGGLRLAPTGYIDLDTVRALGDHVDALPLEPGDTLELDLTDVGFMDSAGLTFLVRLSRRLGATGGRLEVTGICPAVAKVLRLTGIDLFLGTRSPSTPAAGHLS